MDPILSTKEIRIGIVGLGLIGGSLAAAFKKFVPDSRIVGMDINPDAYKYALEKQLIDSVEYTLDKLVKSIDILILSASTSSNLEYIKFLHSISLPLIVTDVSSVKSSICKSAKTLSGEIVFIGGHPMAGKEKGGIQHSTADIFIGAPYILCPPSTGKIPDILITILQAIQSKIVILSPELHDRCVATTSHLPQLMAVALLTSIAESDPEDREIINKIRGSGFHDITRIGESPFEMWQEILGENKENALISLNNLLNKLEKYREYLRKGEIVHFEEEFRIARELRRTMHS
jgi:prephenate dehydrogenase